MDIIPILYMREQWLNEVNKSPKIMLLLNSY